MSDGFKLYTELEVVRKMIAENKNKLVELRIMADFGTKKALLNPQAQQSASMMKAQVQMTEEMISFLEERENKICLETVTRMR